MKFRLIPAGTFQMGSGISPEETAKRFGGEADWWKNEHPQHQVTISKPFFLQTTEVTQGQWRQVMGNNPSQFKQCGKNCPVERVSWNDAQEFIKKLNRLEKTDKYRLPTEAEYEYACRAGSTTIFSFGDDEARLRQYAWYASNSGGKTHPVGQLNPNAWGLYDIQGNVWEWCQDRYGDYPNGLVTNPTGPRFGSNRVLRGGSWHGSPRGTRSADRYDYPPDFRDYNIGFRVARAL